MRSRRVRRRESIGERGRRDRRRDRRAAPRPARPLHRRLVRSRGELRLEQIDAFIQEARDKGWDAGTSQGEYVAAVLYNGLGRYQAAREAATRSRELHYAGGFGLLLSELVEAAVRSDEPELAAAILAERLGTHSGRGTDWARGVQARADALVSEGDAAETPTGSRSSDSAGPASGQVSHDRISSTASGCAVNSARRCPRATPVSARAVLVDGSGRLHRARAPRTSGHR